MVATWWPHGGRLMVMRTAVEGAEWWSHGGLMVRYSGLWWACGGMRRTGVECSALGGHMVGYGGPVVGYGGPVVSCGAPVSNTVHSSPSCCRRCAHASPAIPPPMMPTVRGGARGATLSTAMLSPASTITISPPSSRAYEQSSYVTDSRVPSRLLSSQYVGALFFL